VAEKQSDGAVWRRICITNIVFVRSFRGSERYDRPDGVVGHFLRDTRRFLGPVREVGHGLDDTLSASLADGVLKIRKTDVEEDVA